MKRKKYVKPKIKAQKIKLSFFLNNFNFVDSFGWVGNVYAQSGGSGGTTGDCISGGLESNGGCGCSTSDSNGNAW